MVRKKNLKRYLITPTLLNSWKYCVENQYGNLEDFIKILKKEEAEDVSKFVKGLKQKMDAIKLKYIKTLIISLSTEKLIA